MSLQLLQFRYSLDNLAYLICGDRTALAVDGGAVGPILETIERRGLRLQYVVNTHDHPDHTAGSRELAERSGARRLDHATLLGMGAVELDGRRIDILPTPGHTADSKTFAFPGHLITGDTLFNGTIGNCFSGDLKAFYDSIVALAAYTDDTRIYAGHDYVHSAMAFARSVGEAGAAIDRYLQDYDPAHVVSTLAGEKQVNPYLRFNAPSMVAYLRSRGLPVDTEAQRWESVMTLE